MFAVPVKLPGLATSITLLLTVASTWPSTTSTSQSEISTPFSLMLTPTNSLLVAGSDGSAAAVGSGATLVRGGSPTSEAKPPPWRDGTAPVVFAAGGRGASGVFGGVRESPGEAGRFSPSMVESPGQGWRRDGYDNVIMPGAFDLSNTIRAAQAVVLIRGPRRLSEAATPRPAGSGAGCPAPPPWRQAARRNQRSERAAAASASSAATAEKSAVTSISLRSRTKRALSFS